MIFQNIELYNVSEIEKNPDGDGYIMYRAPKAVSEHLGSQGQRLNKGGTGVELRFEITGEAGADIDIRINSADPAPSARVIPVYYGSMGAPWQEALKVVFTEKTRIHVAPPANMPLLERIHRENGYPFDPHVVRLLLPVSSYEIFGARGAICPPRPEHLPEKRLMIYGSSITHGSLSLLPPGSYAFRTAEALNMDLINMGYAGSARMEGAMADWLAARGDWDIAVLEMGVNSLDMSEEEFAARVQYFVRTVVQKNPGKPVFCIDIFYYQGDMDGSEKADAFRRIVRAAAREYGAFAIDGRDIQTLGSAGLSGDFTHPNIRGHEVMAANLARIIREPLSK